MDNYDKRGELAPRDVVARAIFQEQQKGYEVYLDIRHKGKEFIKKRFPNICKELKMRGFDLTRERVPVTPAVHYSCGGIKVDLYGRTNIKNLFAYGEVACTGAHGANRLASNSLLEATVFPLRLREVNSFLATGPAARTPISCSLHPPSGGFAAARAGSPSLASPVAISNKDLVLAKGIRKELQKLMWGKVGIIRDMRQLREALAKIREWEREMAAVKKINRDFIETKNMITVARLVTEAALKRRTSLGAHFVV